MRHQNQSKHTSISSIDEVLPSRRDHLEKIKVSRVRFILSPFVVEGCVSRGVAVNNTMRRVLEMNARMIVAVRRNIFNRRTRLGSYSRFALF